MRDRLTSLLRDPSSVSLLISNCAVIAIALIEQWELGFVLIVYWWQNIIIGGFNVLKILTFTPGNGDPSKTTEMMPAAKLLLAAFFALHYGFFHYGYFMFLRSFFKSIAGLWVLIAVAVFFLNHLYSFLRNFASDRGHNTLQQLFIAPYQRILPMHLTIIFGSFILLGVSAAFGESAYKAWGEKIVLIFFLILKTSLDLAMHNRGHGKQSSRYRPFNLFNAKNDP